MVCNHEALLEFKRPLQGHDEAQNVSVYQRRAKREEFQRPTQIPAAFFASIDTVHRAEG